MASFRAFSVCSATPRKKRADEVIVCALMGNSEVLTTTKDLLLV